MKYDKTFKVTPNDTAKALGSGGLVVLGTPALVAMIENTCYEVLQKALTDGKTSVGTLVNLHHLRPSSVNDEVLVSCEGQKKAEKYHFTFEAYCFGEKIATGEHQRVVVDSERFLKKVLSKQT